MSLPHIGTPILRLPLRFSATMPTVIGCESLYSAIFSESFTKDLIDASFVVCLAQRHLAAGRHGLDFWLRRRYPANLGPKRNWPGRKWTAPSEIACGQSLVSDMIDRPVSHRNATLTVSRRRDEISKCSTPSFQKFPDRIERARADSRRQRRAEPMRPTYETTGSSMCPVASSFTAIPLPSSFRRPSNPFE